MPQLDAVLVKTSLVDFPERVAAACFLRGCNLHCPYCYNTELVEPRDASQAQNRAANDKKDSQAQDAGAEAGRDQPQFVGLEEIIAHLKKRANVLSGFVISGGEPLCQPQTVCALIKEARSLGYKIKLDTNGMFPDRLQELLDDKTCAPDYVALDVKTAPARYGELQAQNAATVKAFQDLNAGGQNAAAKSLACDSPSEKIIRSINIVSALPADAREFRTVLYPPLVAADDIKAMAALLPKDARWYFARFQNSHCLCAEAEKVRPYTDEEETALVGLAKKKISGAALR